MIHANLFVQAHSEIVLILLAKCDLYQSEDAVRSLVSNELFTLVSGSVFLLAYFLIQTGTGW